MDSESLDRTGTSLEKQKHASLKAPLSADEVGGAGLYFKYSVNNTLCRVPDPRDVSE